MPRAETIPAALLTVADVAKRLVVVHDEVVLAHIRGGRLRAINVGLGSRRPRWRIAQEALEEFLGARTTSPVQPAKPRRTRRPSQVIEFF